ncbi:protein OPAQUE1 isoform X2 [Nymphaea colorata]|uniref:protein OPAQUE1 isoform X2 n=1 Tax=Nymphaea colorata TaxID=210225 RepID=UPI00129E0FDD|nr:protein OPAQUE1 isoform X2 [Nymphaea colorata]
MASLDGQRNCVQAMDAKPNIHKGSKVWVEDREHAWVEAEVLTVSGMHVSLVTVSGSKVSASLKQVLLRDPETEFGGVDDMTKLAYLNEPGVLHNLARRYALNDIYTYTGSILIAVNPFTKLPHLYNVHMMEQYKGKPLGELSPHVFAVADAAYRAMMNEGRSQSILVSGESGAGKTETTKLIMQYLTYVGGRAAGDDRTVEQQVLESNPLLEAFGNAKTVRNDNSSRFGKFVEIQFDLSGRISGAAIRTYLLERSRVVQITDPERNYHCFYQLCASGKDAEKYKVGNPSSFYYLNQSKTYELDGVNNAEEYLKTRRAMDIVGISLEDQEAIFRTLAAILHLGNIQFSPGREHDSSTIKDNKSSLHLQMAADLFKCNTKLLLATLCTRSIQTREGNIIKALDCNAAVASRDALAKTVYSRLFDWLVDKINKSVGQDPDSVVQIGLLDIYGFECFKKNSFEQFCINFANEKLQQHFNEHVFKTEQEEYSNEKINWSYIEFIDNQDVLDLIEKKPIGIISLLNEACMFPKSTHESFSTRLFQSFRGNPRIEKPKYSPTDFTISHYAGKVTYQTESFLDKNRDYVVVEHHNLMSSSKCTFIAGLFPSLPEESSKSSYKFSSVATKFKQQLQALMETLKSTEPHYVRCIKPNSYSLPQKFENQSVLHQLRCGGVLEAVRISLAGYPTRRTYAEFLDRFGILGPEFLDGSYDEKDVADKLLRKLGLENYQLGRSKAFLRAGQIAVLDGKRAEVLDNAAKVIQGCWRTFVAYKDFMLKKSAAIKLQAACRGFVARSIYVAKRKYFASIVIQKYVRGYLLRNAYLQVYSSVLVVQACIRALSVRQKFLFVKEQRAATLIQGAWRMRKAYSFFHRYRTSVIAIQCAWRRKLSKRELRRLRLEANEAGALREAKTKLEKRLEDLSLRLQLEKRLRASTEEVKMVEMTKLQNALQDLKHELDDAKLNLAEECKKNVVLQRDLEYVAKEKKSLDTKLVSMIEERKENLSLKGLVDSLREKNMILENELLLAQRNIDEKEHKMHEAESKCLQLQQNMQSLEEKLLNLEDENRVLRQKALSISPGTRQATLGVAKSFLEGYLEKHELPMVDRKEFFESPTPSRIIRAAPLAQTDRRSKVGSERHQENQEFVLRCVREDLGYINGKPVAACSIFKCLLRWHAFEAERTVIFDRIIEAINDVLEVEDEKKILPYWLSNASALLCLLQKNLKTNGFLSTPQRRTGSTGLIGRMAQSFKSPSNASSLLLNGTRDCAFHVEARYPAILFKQQLTACLEKIFGLIRDNVKKDILPMLSLCIQAPKTAKVPPGKTSRSSLGSSQQSLSSHWDNIIKFLDSLMDSLRENYVPSFLIRKLITQVFSFINIQLFNSLLLRRECCTFSNGEYVKSGLAELERWISDVTEEYAGTSWHELKYIRQAVGFLVIHQKRRKTLNEIRQDLCPALTIQQLYRICTLYWDDKYGTQSVSNEVVAQMREIVSKDSSNFMTNSFLLDDDLSIPFSAEDLSQAIPSVEPEDVEMPSFLHEMPSLHLLLHH